MKARRIAYFGSSTAVDGGSELCLLRMARRFNDDFKVTLFLPDDGPLFRAAASCGIDCINLEFLRLRKHRGLDWMRWWASVRRARERLAMECRERGVQLIHFNDFIDLPFYTVVRELDLPSLAHLRLIVQNPLARHVYLNRVGRAGSWVIPVSGAVRRAMLGEHCSIPHRVIHDPAPDSSIFHPKEKIQPNTPFRLVLVSKLLENKGHLHFCRIAGELEERAPGRFAFTLVAPPSPGREDYEREIRTLFGNLPADRARFIPGASHGELGGILRGSDLLLHLPDMEDSFPGVVLEAMACGVPVLAHRVGGIPEQLSDGEAGLLIRQGDEASAVREVLALADDAAKWKKYAEWGIKKVSTDFSAETHFALLQKLYEERLRR